MATPVDITTRTVTKVAPANSPPLAERLLDQAVASAKARAATRTPAAATTAATTAGTYTTAASPTRDPSIVVALDGTTFSHAALAPALQMAKCLGLPLTIVQAAAPAHNPFLDEQLDEEQGETEAHQSLHSVASQARGQGLQVTEVLVTGALASAPARAVLAAAEEFHAKMIVMATHGRTGLSRTLHGSVAAEVVHSTGIPVLLVRP